jgi:acyl dehydratase
MPEITKDAFVAMLGTEAGVSRWFEIDQKRIDAFADATDDWQFIHVDPERAAETPFGTTIAHGFLTLGMLSAMYYDAIPDIVGTKMGVNYGFDRIRFLSPVPVGARVRARFVMVEVKELRPGELTSTMDVTVEIEGSDRPALKAVWIGRRYL